MKITLFNRLKKYDSYLTSAHYYNYIRSLTTKEVDEIVEIGAELGITIQTRHCPKCTLTFMKRLAVPYFEQKQKLEGKKNGKKETDGKEAVENGSQKTSDN